jgi:HYR domain
VRTCSQQFIANSPSPVFIFQKKKFFMKHFASVAPAALATTWPLANTLSRCFAQAKTVWLSLFMLLSALAVQAAPPLKTWDGSSDNNWNTPANWTPAAVPVAGDSVRVPSGTANQPVIFSGTMAKAKNVVVLSGAILTVNAGGELELASALNVPGLIIEDGTVVNIGLIKVKSGFQGIVNSGDFFNSGTIRLGEAASSPYAFTEDGIQVSGAGDNFTNYSTGNIIILRPGNNGILMFLDGGNFTNYGKITVREAGLNPATAATSDGIDARDGDFVNETTGDIVISKITANGLNCRRTGSFTNKGNIKIGNVGLTVALEIREGINNAALFTNTSTGQITIDTCSNSGILNNLGTFNNSGQISIGEAKANSISNLGLGNLGPFNNYDGATLTIKNAKGGILGGGLGGLLTNYPGATITIGQVTNDGIYQFGIGGTDNQGTLSIGSTGSIGGYGINNACQFINQFGAELTISNTANNAILNTFNPDFATIKGSFQNGGKVSIGNLANAGGPAIVNTATCTFENLFCVSSLNITANNIISNAGTFTNAGNIIENASGNSSITDNSGTIQNLNGGTFSVTGSNTGVNSTATGTIWTGCNNTNWANLYNWNGLAVPVAADNVLIPGSSNDPTIFGGTAAVAKSVVVRYNAILTLNTSSNLTISGSTTTGLFNGSTVNNAGTLNISNTGGVGLHNTNTLIGYAQNGSPIYGGGIFNNNSGGELAINNTTDEGIFQEGASLNNFAEIKIGHTGSIGKDGIESRGSHLDNKAGGEITVDRTVGDGIFIFTHSMTNAGKITIGGTAGTTIGGAGITNGATISNNAGGEILIDRTTQQGISNSFATFNNYASLKIGSAQNIGYYGISNQNGNFNNYPTGEITIDRTGLSGIYNYYNANNRAFGNSGKIFIGKTAAIGGEGIANDGTFNNNSDGEITIDRSSNNGIYVRDDNDSNTRPAAFNNSGKLTIGGTATIGDNGIRNRVTFNNNTSGDITIDRTTGDGLQNFQGNFNNAAKITIGTTVAPTGDGLENAATFNNQACGEIALFDNLANSSDFTNIGLLRMNTALPHTNSGTFTNDGIIEYPQGSLIPNVTNNDVIVQPVNGECPVANALQVGSSNNFNIGTTWYKNSNLTMSAGTYDAGTNTFTTNGLADGSTATLYFTVSDGANGCTRTVSIRLTYDDVTRPTIACPANTTLNTQDDGGADCAVTLTYIATFTDNCDGTGPATKVNGPASGTSLNVSGSPYTVIYTYTDKGGNTVASNCTFTVTVKDNTLPTFTCPTPPLVLNTNGASGCSVTIPDLVNMVNNEADNCALRTTSPVTQSVPAGAYTGAAHGQTIPVTVTVWDNASPANSTACTITFTVNDDDAPSIICPSNIARNSDPNQCSAVVTYADPLFSDNCTALLARTSAANTASGLQFPIGTTNIAWKATDAAGNTAVCSFTVTVTDGQAPSIVCPANIIRSTDVGQCGAVVAYTNPTYSDNCLLNGPAGLNHLMGGLSNSTFQKGTTVIIWQATDGVGLTATCSFTITVNDTQKPSIACPANQTRSTSLGLCSAVVTYPMPTGSDNCGLPAGQPIWVSGGTNASGNTATFQKGINTVTWRATDAAGNTQTCTFRVTVNDTEAPTMTCPAAMSLSTAVNTCSATATYTNPTFTDNCAPTSGTAIRISGLVSGSAFPLGNSNVVFQATDAAGNTRRCTMVVTVTDNQPPVITCPAAVVTTGTGTPCSATVFYSSATASDNCAGTLIPFLVTGLASGSQFPAGVTNNTFRAVAPNGQSAECSFTVTVNCGSGLENTGIEIREEEEERIQQYNPLELVIAPNPALSTVTVSIEGVGAGGGSLLVFDAVGRLVLWQVVAENQRTAVFQVDGAEFALGMYRVNLRTETGMVTKTLVVVK